MDTSNKEYFTIPDKRFSDTYKISKEGEVVIGGRNRYRTVRGSIDRNGDVVMRLRPFYNSNIRERKMKLYLAVLLVFTFKNPDGLELEQIGVTFRDGDKRNMDLDNLVLYKNPYSTVDSYLDVKNYLRKPAEWKPAIAL